MLLRSMIAASITVGLMGMATAPWHIVGLRLVEGAFTGTVTASTALVATSAPKERLGFNLGMVQTRSLRRRGFRTGDRRILVRPFRLSRHVRDFGRAVDLGVIMVVFFVQEVFTRQEPTTASAEGFGSRWAWMLGSMMLTMLTVLFMVRFVQMGIRPVMPLYLQELGHFTDTHAATVSGWMFGVLGVSSAASAIIFGRHGDKVGHQKILFWCVLGAGLLYLPMAVAQSAWHMIALQGLFGIAAGGYDPLVPTRSSPTSRRPNDVASPMALRRRRERSARRLVRSCFRS